jgi:hypothetical protein
VVRSPTHKIIRHIDHYSKFSKECFAHLQQHNKKFNKSYEQLCAFCSQFCFCINKTTSFFYLLSCITTKRVFTTFCDKFLLFLRLNQIMVFVDNTIPLVSFNNPKTVGLFVSNNSKNRLLIPNQYSLLLILIVYISIPKIKSLVRWYKQISINITSWCLSTISLGPNDCFK